VEMVKAILQPLTSTNVMRFYVSFPVKGSTLDEAIGRAAHIQFLDNTTFIREFIGAYRDYFV